MAQNCQAACLRPCPIRAHCRRKFSAPFPGERPDMTGAIPALSHRLRTRALSLWAAAICLGGATTLLSAPALARGPDGIADVAEKVIDAVVNISTTQTVEAKAGGGGGGGGDRGAMPQLPPGSPFEEFFDDFFKNR